MNLQYISDSSGKTTGVYIPIEEWNELKNRYKGIENEEINVPEWHKAVVRERYEEYKKNPEEALDFDDALNDLETEL